MEEDYYFDKKMVLSSEIVDELKWWINALPTAIRNIYHGIPECTLTTDASQIGWGTITFIQQEAECHINILERGTIT